MQPCWVTAPFVRSMTNGRGKRQLPSATAPRFSQGAAIMDEFERGQRVERVAEELHPWEMRMLKQNDIVSTVSPAKPPVSLSHTRGCYCSFVSPLRSQDRLLS
jgi:hypothetical protein